MGERSARIKQYGIGADITDAATQTLDEYRGTSAIILFGSRARGDERTQSDWDIAIVVEGTRASDYQITGQAPSDPQCEPDVRGAYGTTTIVETHRQCVRGDRA